MKNWRGIKRCQRMYELAGQPCEICGWFATARHHRNGNQGDNAPENVAFVCAKHHAEAHPRTRLTPSQVSSLRGTEPKRLPALAQRYGISRRHAYGIHRGERLRGITG